jgi:hypothetical protein
MGQVPSLPGGEVMALLDVAPTAGTLSAQGAGPGGAGVHVPLLARAGETDPSIPCYPLAALYGAQSARVVEAVHAVLAAQRGSIAAGDKAGLDVKADEGTPLVALVVPHDGEKRDLAIQLAIGLFRLAMNEGNGHEEGQ